MSRCLTKFHISGLGEPYLYQNLGDFTRIGKFSAEDTKYAEHYISYGYSFRHIRKLCGNTKIIRRVFADKLVVYSYYQEFTIQLKLENLGSSKTKTLGTK